MDRKHFIMRCGMACLGAGAVSNLLQSCSSLKTLSGSISGDDLIINLKDFETNAANEIHYKKYIVINNNTLKFPICVYRHDAKTFSALWMQCTHQGAELQVFGDKLQCPAHGSEFNNKGQVIGSPANTDLRNFPTVIEGNILKISLKKV